MATCSESDCDRPAVGRGLCGQHYGYRRRHGNLPPLLLRKRPPTCVVDDCDRKPVGRDLCGMHYQRVQKLGSTDQPIATAPDEVRFWSKVDKVTGDNGCWLWTAGLNTDGYGNVWWNGVTRGAHRVAYEILVGPIPRGRQLDHLCRVRHCVNAAHLEPVTAGLNNRRSRSPSARNARRTHCVNGHALTDDNIYVHPKRRSRHCRACIRIRNGQSAAASP